MNDTTMLQRFSDQHTIQMTTYRRDGRAVGTPVSIAVDGPRAYVRTFESAGKFKRIRNNPIADIAPSTFGGRATGPTTRVRVRVLTGEESQTARRLIERKHPWLHGLLVPLGHRLTGKKTVYLELRPAAGENEQTPATGAAA